MLCTHKNLPSRAKQNVRYLVLVTDDFRIGRKWVLFSWRALGIASGWTPQAPGLSLVSIRLDETNKVIVDPFPQGLIVSTHNSTSWAIPFKNLISFKKM